MKHFLVFSRGVPALLQAEETNSVPSPLDYACKLYYVETSRNETYWAGNLTQLFKYVSSNLHAGETVQNVGSVG